MSSSSSLSCLVHWRAPSLERKQIFDVLVKQLTMVQVHVEFERSPLFNFPSFVGGPVEVEGGLGSDSKTLCQF